MDYRDEELLKKLIIDSVRVLNNTAQAYIRQEIAKGGLTEPQVNAMIEIVAQDGLTITELSRRLHLNHSTVSGIVDRLEARGHIMRNRDEKDGRYTRIFATERVNSFMKRRIYDRYTPFVEVIRRATPEEKKKIAEGFTTLERLLRDIEDAPGAAQSDDSET